MGSSTVMSTLRSQVDSNPSTKLYTTKPLINYSFVRKRSPDVQVPRVYPTHQQRYPSLDLCTKKNQVVQMMNVNPGELGLSSADVLEGPLSGKGPDCQSPYPQCDQCTPCPQECAQASCVIPGITSECTEQCLVVACDDPDHPDVECQVENGNEPCDGSCVRSAECPECPGLEEILQCCTDYHSYFAEPKSYDGPTMATWNNTLADIFCGCEDNTRPPPTSDPCIPEIYHTTPLPHPLGVLRSGSDPSSGCTTPSPLLSASSHSPIGSTINTPLQQPVPPHICMWGNCQLTFSTLAELVGHVNLQHLRGSGLVQSDFPPIGEPSFFSQSTLSCHWGNCAMYPSPSSIPSSSSGPADQAIDLLTTHLMQDHLGVNLPFPTTTTAVSPPPPNRLVSPSASQEAASIPSSSPPPDCHTCGWISCSQTFASSDELTAHIASMHVGSGKAHYDCFWEGCVRNGANGFSSKQKISRHLQSHTGHRPFQCKICSQNFSEAATLQQHMRRHTQEKPYVCDHPGCGRAFAITGALTIHKRTHNGQRPFKCTHCNKAFSESSNLSKHLRTHTGARPYECPEEGCKKTFARPDQLARHMSVHRRKDNAIVAGSS
ncbi:hypothetical protein BKA82DRAFT_997882 [Pisolithus tinctorius]|uniref:C2H2-type domain-containing protein n=1 Tax=Pisolithus tinctorius Marx 270 TaxID=870435 RepID=A0A0C3KDQ3_PISTI|nr:hypothetical protein BKA82DRAFT_997882 [Pisolithus tinctorius]KIO07737.1 hypothetical protein M404DRAFT_997882 [Pisolithus tinctorius Marx 270]